MTPPASSEPVKAWRGVSTGAAFLMAVSAIGPGFLTQTTRFTAEHGATLAFAILVSVLIDIGAQLNTWRVICVSGKRGQELASALVPGLGYLVSAVIIFGSLAFNIGNLMGCAQGLQELVGWPRWKGISLSTMVALGLFLLPTMLKGMDWFTRGLGLAMIGMTGYVLFITSPPVAEAARQAVLPSRLDSRTFFATVTLVGGTIGGYIMFSGAHRLLDGGVEGRQQLGRITWASVQGILITAVMRSLLFLAVLGLVSTGVTLGQDRAVFQAFEAGGGQTGHFLAGLIFWSAAITSVVGCSYTAITFTGVRSARPRSRLILGFVLISLAATLALEQTEHSPEHLLILAGTLNGLLLPIVFAVVLAAAYSPRLMGDYRHPWWAGVLGAVAWLAIAALAVMATLRLFDGS